jgi:hypothetical protein
MNHGALVRLASFRRETLGVERCLGGLGAHDVIAFFQVADSLRVDRLGIHGLEIHVARTLDSIRLGETHRNATFLDQR